MYGDTGCALREEPDILRDHGGRVAFRSGDGEPEGETGKASAFAVEE